MSGAVSIRHAGPADLDFVVELVNHEEVEPFLGLRRARDRTSILAEIERTQAEPDAFGRLIIEADGERAGLLGYKCVNPIHRIAESKRSPSTRTSAAAGSPARRCTCSSASCSSSLATTGSSSSASFNERDPPRRRADSPRA